MTRLFSVVIDAHDPHALARWWADALATPLAGEEDDEAWLEPPNSFELVFGAVPDAKSAKNRVHLDLATYTKDEHAELVARLRGAGATSVDVGQPATADWVVLADPEGNEFCVVEPRPEFMYQGRIGDVFLETTEPAATAAMWIKASGWNVVIHTDNYTVLRAPSGGPYFVIAAADTPKTVKNRIHLDVAPRAGDDHVAAVEQLVAAGTRRADVGQKDVPWVVLADPGGNEFCVLTPR